MKLRYQLVFIKIQPHIVQQWDLKELDKDKVHVWLGVRVQITSVLIQR